MIEQTVWNRILETSSHRVAGAIATPSVDPMKSGHGKLPLMNKPRGDKRAGPREGLVRMLKKKSWSPRLVTWTEEHGHASVFTVLVDCHLHPLQQFLLEESPWEVGRGVPKVV